MTGETMTTQDGVAVRRGQTWRHNPTRQHHRVLACRSGMVLMEFATVMGIPAAEWKPLRVMVGGRGGWTLVHDADTQPAGPVPANLSSPAVPSSNVVNLREYAARHKAGWKPAPPAPEHAALWTDFPVGEEHLPPADLGPELEILDFALSMAQSHLLEESGLSGLGGEPFLSTCGADLLEEPHP